MYHHKKKHVFVSEGPKMDHFWPLFVRNCPKKWQQKRPIVDKTKRCFFWYQKSTQKTVKKWVLEVRYRVGENFHENGQKMGHFLALFLAFFDLQNEHKNEWTVIAYVFRRSLKNRDEKKVKKSDKKVSKKMSIFLVSLKKNDNWFFPVFWPFFSGFSPKWRKTTTMTVSIFGPKKDKKWKKTKQKSFKNGPKMASWWPLMRAVCFFHVLDQKWSRKWSENGQKNVIFMFFGQKNIFLDVKMR